LKQKEQLQKYEEEDRDSKPKFHKASKNKKDYHKPKSSIRRGKKDRRSGENSTQGK
jgi:hypothetical protein